MKHFAIFLCMVIGFVCADSQRVEIGEDDFKADEDARKADSVDTNETITDDKAIRSKDDQTSAHSSDCASNEAETCKKPSSAAMSTNVASEVKKSGQRTQLRKPAQYDLLSLLNHSHRNISANQHSIGDNRSLPRTSAQVRDTSIKTKMLISWSYRTERRGAQAHRNVTSGTIEGLEDLDTYGIISQVVKGYVEVPAKVKYRFIHRIVEQICHSADIQLENFAPGYWNEVVRLSNRHTAPRETSAVLRKYFEMKSKESETNRPSMDETTRELYEQIEPMRNDYEEGETVERVGTWFECPNTEVETRFNTWDINGIVKMFVDLCMVIGFIGIIIFLIAIRWRISILKAKVNAMYIMKSSPRDEDI